MKTYKVKEVWKSTGFTYIQANSKEEAISKLNDGDGDFREEESEHKETFWNTLDEVS